MTLAERLSDFTASLRFETIPVAVVDSVRLRLLDTLGLALAGSHADLAPSMLGLVAGEQGACTVLGTSHRAPAPLAILINGAFAHGLDFDDTHAGSITHASAVVLPTALALAEAQRLDGRALIVAAVAGYESITRLGMAAAGAFHDRGWHATAVCGPFAAALVAGRCAGLDRSQLAASLGIAGSCASGVMEFLEDGSWVKRLHPGWAGHAGAVAATLAHGGFTGPATILEGRFGFYATFVGKAPDATPFETLGKEWETLAVAFKPYPCCHYNHAFLDCALELRAAHGIRPEAIDSIECRVPAGEVPITCEPTESKARPRTAYDAQFSLPFSVAAAFVDGQVGIGTYTSERLTDDRILEVAARVRHVVDADAPFPRSFPGWVRVRLIDGRTVEARAPDGRGGAARPLPPAAIVAKFRDNASRALPADRVADLEAAVLEVDRLSSVEALLALCRA
jgi:2-methylcitrate dehydratase PrpD